jgi:hypothetical protein
MEVGGDAHVAPPEHGQKDDLSAVGQSALGRAGPAEVLKSATLHGG